MRDIQWDKIGFDAYRTDVVLMARWKDGKWSEIVEDDTFAFTLDPFTCVFHYAVSCFEGLKAFTQKDGKVILFRPEENAHRMQRTARYLGLPEPSDEMFIEMCERCVRANREFLPPYGHDASLYVRPLLMGAQPKMQLTPPNEVIFAVMCAPAGSYYGAFLKSFAAAIPQNYDRAAPKGSGSYKVGANYASTFRPYQIAHNQGYQELLYLNSKTHEFIDEYGSSNFFGIKGNKYVTPLSDSVLPSITNKSLQELAADLGLVVEKRAIPLEELSEFDEVGACGTAVVITPISHIDVKEVLEDNAVTKQFRYMPDGEVGPVCTRLYKALTSIQKGESEDIHGWCHEVKM
ncbi:MAG: branched-chain amino acid aminotransferase [Candidatus Cryptobacteroides sp.]|nr:branched-chain amino acid aminotransferase [Candidatus Cryptobacteroides sp.]